MAEESQRCIKHRVKWIIDGVTRMELQDPAFSFSSEPFSIGFGDIKTEWTANIESHNGEYLFAGLNKLRIEPEDVTLNFDISIKDHLRAERKKTKSSEFQCLGWNEFIGFEKLFDPSNKYLDKGTKMELVFTIDLFNKNDDPVIPAKTYPKFLNDKKLADFTLVSSEDKPFQVHRFALADASDFFMKMFTTDMQEKLLGTVKFEDLDTAALKEVIRFIYRGKAHITEAEKATKVLYGAEKFMLPGLKAICCDILENELSKDNSIEILAIADMYHEKDLEELALKHIMANYDAVKQTEGWKLLTVPLLTKITDALDAASKIPLTILNSTL